MKKLTLLAAMAVCGMGAANAQYVGEPGIAATSGDVYDVIQLDVATVESLQSAGKTVNNYSIDEITRHLYVWENTFIANENPVGPGVDGHQDSYTSLAVSNIGWSGFGVAFDAVGGEQNMATSHFSDDTHFHIAFKSSNEPASIAVIVLDGSEAGFSPAKLSVGSTAFVDNGATFPLVGDFNEEGDWVALDITFSELKKLFPSFNYVKTGFSGNVYSILAGGVEGKSIDIDAVYFYGPKAEDGAVESVKADNVDILVSSRTINATVAGFELYNIAGQLVKSTKSTVMGVEDLNAGLYVVKAGNTVKKVVIR